MNDAKEKEREARRIAADYRLSVAEVLSAQLVAAERGRDAARAKLDALREALRGLLE